MKHLIFLLLGFCLAAVGADDPLMAAAKKFRQEIAPKNADYELVYFMTGKFNEENVNIYRFEPNKEKKVNLNGPRIVVVLNEKGELREFARVNESLLRPPAMSEEKAREEALAFLAKYAPDLKDVSFQWVSTRKLKLIDNQGRTHVVVGTWAKYRDPQSGRYLWVLFGADGGVMEFDRESVWSFIRGGRVTERWLDDDWFGRQMEKKN